MLSWCCPNACIGPLINLKYVAAMVALPHFRVRGYPIWLIPNLKHPAVSKLWLRRFLKASTRHSLRHSFKTFLLYISLSIPKLYIKLAFFFKSLGYILVVFKLKSVWLFRDIFSISLKYYSVLIVFKLKSARLPRDILSILMGISLYFNYFL